jgi:BMFP domain-containing protein YqiC
MLKLFCKTLQLGLFGITNTFLISSITQAVEPPVITSQATNSVESVSELTQINPYTQETATIDQAESVSQLSEETEGMEQVTNVSQLPDVSPGDWAFEALRSLLERYGCIAGYPDGTYRGNRATSRYEFAAGLNACLKQIERLIASSTADFVRKEDLETLQRLVEEFRTELTAIEARLDKLEGRVAFLEDHQFSATTKLNIELITYLGDAFGENADPINNTALGHRTRLDFNTSFTGHWQKRELRRHCVWNATEVNRD